MALIQNLIPLFLFRPLRLCLPSRQVRSARMVLLKITHVPYIASIWVYEELNTIINRWQEPSRAVVKSSKSALAGPRTPQRLHPRNKSGASVPQLPANGGTSESGIAAALGTIEHRLVSLERKVDGLST